MVGEAVYGRGRAGQKNAFRGKDDRGKDVVPSESSVHDFDRKKIWVKRANFILYSSKPFQEILDIFFCGLLLENLSCLGKSKNIYSTLVWHMELMLFLNGRFSFFC